MLLRNSQIVYFHFKIAQARTPTFTNQPLMSPLGRSRLAVLLAHPEEAGRTQRMSDFYSVTPVFLISVGPWLFSSPRLCLRAAAHPYIICRHTQLFTLSSL